MAILLTSCSSAQSQFEKYYNSRSNDFNKLGEKQTTAEGLAILQEIEVSYDKLPEDQRRKFLKRMGDTYLMMSMVYAAQNINDKSLSYLQKSADAGFNDPAFITKLKEFNNIRNNPNFLNIINQMKNPKLAEQADIADIKISAMLLRKDLSVLQESLEEGHQGLYQYHTKKEMDELFAETKSLIKDEMTPAEFYKIISPLVVAIKDGHTRVLIPVAPSGLKNQIPVGFTVIDDKLYISKAYHQGMKKYLGYELESINKLSAAVLIQFALTNFSSDGDNKTFKLTLLNNPGWFSDAVMVLLGRLEKFDLLLKENTGIVSQKVTIEGITSDSLNSLLSKNGNTTPAELKLLDKLPTAILTIRTFSAKEFKNADIKFKDFLQASFTTLNEKKIKNLIIDVRGNGGGEDEFGRLLYSYFAKSDFTYYTSLTIANNKFKLFDYVKGGQRTAPDDFATPNKNGTLDVTNKYNSNVGIHSPSIPAFTGNIYVLIDGGCFSTTSEFLSQLHANTKAIFIGEESGGNYYTNNSGIIAGVNLPNSKLHVNIPLLKYVNAVPASYPHKNNGVIPQYEVPKTVGDIVNNIDAPLNFALNLISKNK